MPSRPVQRWDSLFFQFRVLYRVFLLRVIDLELLASDGDPSRLMGQFISVFYSISFFCTFPVPFLLVRRGPIPVAGAYMFEHFLMETTMTIAGLVAVLSWDAAFPDRRDMLVLGPLPVPRATFFLSKLAALFAAPLLAAGAFNLFAGFGWPMVFAVGVGSKISLLRTMPAYWFTVTAAAAFMIFVVVAVQGIAANLLPRQIFLRLSAVIQAIALCVLLTTYFLGPSFNSPAALAATEHQQMLRWLPAYWFVGLFNQLNGSMHPELIALAHRAWLALAVSALAALSAVFLSYFRMLARIVEQPDIVPTLRARAFSFGNSLAGVITIFSLRTLLRSRQHRMILSFYAGIGITIVFGFLHTKFVRMTPSLSQVNTIFLLSSILAVSLVVLALRVVIAIPITLRANWVFRATQVRPAYMYHQAVRTSLLWLGVAPVVAALAGGFVASYSPVKIAGHLVFMVLLGAILVELCLFSFRKISFACSYLPGKANLHFIFWFALLASMNFLKSAANREGQALGSFSSFFFMFAFLVVLAVVLHRVGSFQARHSEQIVFEEDAVPEIVTLKLNS